MAHIRKLVTTPCRVCYRRLFLPNVPDRFSSTSVLSGVTTCRSGGHSGNASVGVDIGFPPPSIRRRRVLRERAAVIQEQRKKEDLEAQARHRTLRIPLDKVTEVWEKTSGPYHIRAVAHHYNIFKDMFDGADFVPFVPVKIAYQLGPSEFSSVYRGNVITPSESAEPPTVKFEDKDSSLWTLLMTNPDGHLVDNEAEYVHWFIGNIPGNEIAEGDTLVDYLPPFPARGTGYHRYVFILFKQEGRIDYSSERRRLPCHNLQERTFSTLEFYRLHQDRITPTGLGFFQSRWDPSVQQTFHQTLDMREPVFEYDHPKQYKAPQVKWPHKKPLQYLNKFLPKE
ncbi:large ribosomal subunit protein mL38-like isoform X1 [Diadema antillarum]|uniref:large ribosomal subunit protein mL38-like isoform X1 n=1 Tax=Diadema antillarum TaxID=105358 RepID=UPI003A83E285